MNSLVRILIWKVGLNLILMCTQQLFNHLIFRLLIASRNPRERLRRNGKNSLSRSTRYI